MRVHRANGVYTFNSLFGIPWTAQFILEVLSESFQLPFRDSAIPICALTGHNITFQLPFRDSFNYKPEGRHKSHPFNSLFGIRDTRVQEHA